MHKEILREKQQKFLPVLSKFKRDFGLVGGTAIALQIGHRESIDFDLFSLHEFKNSYLRQIIKSNGFNISHVAQDERGEFSFTVEGIRLTFLYYPFPIKFNLEIENYIKSPDLLTLAAMKAYALSRRNKWKDYVDLYFIINSFYSVKQISVQAKKIFKEEFNERIFRESLVYFQDIDYSEKISFMPGYKRADKEIKRALIKFSLDK